MDKFIISSSYRKDHISAISANRIVDETTDIREALTYDKESTAIRILTTLNAMNPTYYKNYNVVRIKDGVIKLRDSVFPANTESEPTNSATVPVNNTEYKDAPPIRGYIVATEDDSLVLAVTQEKAYISNVFTDACIYREREFACSLARRFSTPSVKFYLKGIRTDIVRA